MKRDAGTIRPHSDTSAVTLLTLPENLWRLRLAIFVSMLSAFTIELLARYLRSIPEGPDLLSKGLSLLALVLLCGSALYLILLLHDRNILKIMVSVATFVLIFAQTLTILREFSQTDAYLQWSEAVEGPLLLMGVLLLLTSFYFALLETVTVKAVLRRERVELCSEIVERKRIQADLKDSRDQLRNLSAHVEQVREAERGKIAREIHDELGQTLTSLKIDLASLRSQLPHGSEACDELIDSMSHLINTTVQATRRIMAELHPAILDDLGLDAALENLVHEFQGRNGIPCAISSKTDDALLSPDQRVALFRIVQECLTNITRHAEASQAQVQLAIEGDRVRLEVADNGKGIRNGSNGYGGKSFGILGIRERAMLLNGEAVIQSEPGHGTRVVVTLPVGQLPRAVV